MSGREDGEERPEKTGEKYVRKKRGRTKSGREDILHKRKTGVIQRAGNKSMIGSRSFGVVRFR